MRVLKCCAVAVAALALSVGAAGCATKPVVAAEKAAAATLISPKEENQLGLQMHQELAKQGVKYVTDPAVLDYVNRIAQPILAQAKKDRPDVQWKVFVVDTPDINAFSTPGGYIYVQTGLINAVKNDAELAGVIAHEAGHVTGRHAARSMVEAYGLQTVASIALGQNPTQLQQIAASVIANGILLHHTRSEETEADEYGVRYARAAGFDPTALITFFRTLQQKTGQMPKLLTWLSDHPATSDRIAHLQQYIAQNHLRGGQLDLPGTQLAAVKAKLPPPTATGGAGQQR